MWVEVTQPDGTVIQGSIVMEGKSQVMIKTTNDERLTVLKSQLKRQPVPASK